MAVLQMPPRQREQSREPAPAPSRDTGVFVEVSRFAVLIVCFAISVVVVIQRDHRQVNGPGVKPAAVTHPVTAPNPSSNARVSSGRISFGDDNAAAFIVATDNAVNSVANGVDMVLDSVWEPALWLSNRIVGFVADSWVNPVTGDRLILRAAPNAFNFASAILALAILAIVTVSLAGPIYAGWKSWRLAHSHVLRLR
jgi:hypothetical protein